MVASVVWLCYMFFFLSVLVAVGGSQSSYPFFFLLSWSKGGELLYVFHNLIDELSKYPPLILGLALICFTLFMFFNHPNGFFRQSHLFGTKFNWGPILGYLVIVFENCFFILKNKENRQKAFDSLCFEVWTQKTHKRKVQRRKKI